MLPRIKAGDVVPLAVTSANRIKALPDVSISMELGLADKELTAWYAYMAPTGTPQEIVDMLNTELNKILLSAKIRQRLEDSGGMVRPVSPGNLRQFIREEHGRWGQIVRSANLRSE